MDTIVCLRSFIKVAEAGSFAEAARRLCVSPATVTKSVQALEKRLGARLINRNTRRIHLTEAGVLYWKHCQTMLSDLERVEAEAAALGQLPRGRLRLTAAPDCRGLEVEAAVLSFLEKYPEISIDLDLTARFVDLVKEEFDLAIRAVGSQVLDASLVTRRLTTARLVVCASPDYLQRHGRPEQPGDLKRHSCLVYAGTPWRNEWPFVRGDELRKVSVHARLQTNDNQLLCQAAKGGAGIVVQPSFNVWRDLRSGELELVLNDWHVGKLEICVVFPHRQYVPAKVRLFIDFLVERFRSGADRDIWLDRAGVIPQAERPTVTPAAEGALVLPARPPRTQPQRHSPPPRAPAGTAFRSRQSSPRR
jgi:DNA-binding transcriptional LysR family regulator